MKRLSLALLVILVVSLLLAPASTPAASAQSVPMVAYIVQPGDTLAKIAVALLHHLGGDLPHQRRGHRAGPERAHSRAPCSTCPNRCATPPSSVRVYDHGPSMYANGTVTGNVYTVAAGDTWYSIGVRFGLPWETISAANGGGGLYPGRQLIIPGLCQRAASGAEDLHQHHAIRRPARSCPPPSR